MQLFAGHLDELHHIVVVDRLPHNLLPDHFRHH